MIIEIMAGVFCLSFVFLVAFSVVILKRMKKTINHVNKTILEVSEILNALKLPTLDLVNNANDLVVDIKKKSEGIDVLFKPLYSIKKTKLESKNGTEKISEVIECVAEGIRLFGKIKNEMK